MKIRDGLRERLSAATRTIPRRYRTDIATLAREIREDRVTGLAAEIAFFAVLSVFPWLLLVTAAIGWFATFAEAGLADEAKAFLLQSLDRIFTERGAGAVEAVNNVFEQERVGVLSISAVLALWSSSRGFAAAMAALNLAYDSEERRSWLQLRLRGLALALGSVVLAALLLLAFVAGPLLGRGRAVADLVGLGTAFLSAWHWARWPLAFVVLVVGAAWVYAVAPCRSYGWRQNLPGAGLAAAFGVFASLAFGFYLRVAATGNPIYGALGGGLALLVWLYLLALGLLIGAEANAVISKHPPPTSSEAADA